MNNNITRIRKDDCVGCGSCFNACPKGAIKMTYDSEGFLYPEIDSSLCINCGICFDKCPEAHEPSLSDKQECYAAMASDEIRMKSSSGGVFTLLAEKVLEHGGYVCGAAYTEDYMGVEHIIVSDEDGLAKLRGSKYVQSNTKDIYRQIKSFLEQGREVLFSGCPCQVAGLKSFLGKDYKKFLTVDLVCHGANSMKAYHEFLHEISGARKIESVNFREKEVFGWSTPITVKFTDGTIIRQSCDKSLWYRGFLEGIINRPSCGHCRYATPNRIGDVSLGDFWGISSINPELDDNKGTGLVLINSKKGKKAFEKIQTNLKLYQEIKRAQVIEIARTRNGQLLLPRKPHINRAVFFEKIRENTFSEAMEHSLNEHYDIGVVGWWYNENYGGTLTYFALHQILKSMGLSVLMIEKPTSDPNYVPDYSKIPRRFAKKHYSISKNIHPNKLGELNAKCTAFISGSDQLFNPWLWEYSGPSYYLDFAHPGKNLISYASSFGEGFKSTETFKERISYYLHRFSQVSVREDYAVDIAKDNFGITAKKVLDPVFVCDPNEYHKLADNSELKIGKKYFSSFFLDPCKEKKESILYLKKKLALPYVNLIHACDFEANSKKLDLDEIKPDLDIEDFLNYYRNSEFIITDSYHGTCFAIIFRKPFISIANKKRGVGRFVSMLSEIGLSDRLVYDYKEIYARPELLKNINYDEVYERIEPLRTESYNWLKKAIFEPYNKAANPFHVLDIKQYDNVLKILSLQEKIYWLQREIDSLKKKEII